MKTLHIVLALCAIACTQLASAKEATFCRSGLIDLAQSNKPAAFTNDKTVFTCGNGLKNTLPELYAAGWKVNTLTWPHFEESNTTSVAFILIEKD